jgi:DNA invertase Pin-like site-specific DNA recombinase
MIAAIYARKSTEQRGRDSEDKSVALQIANARGFAQSRGWTVRDAHVYADDAISGAETRKLVNRQRLIALIDSGRAVSRVDRPRRIALQPHRRRRSLRRAETDRAARDRDLVLSGGTAIAHGDFASNITGMVRAEMNAEYRRQIARFTHESHVRKHKAGHVTGGRCFGYDNICSAWGA